MTNELAPVTAPADTPKDSKDSKPRTRTPKHRGPPEDGIPSKTKVMVANLPYDLSEEKVRSESIHVNSNLIDIDILTLRVYS